MRSIFSVDNFHGAPIRFSRGTRHGGAVGAPGEFSRGTFYVDERELRRHANPQVPILMGEQRLVEGSHLVDTASFVHDAENGEIVRDQ